MEYQLKGAPALMTNPTAKSKQYSYGDFIFSPDDAKRAYFNYHLVRRKYILKHVCEAFNINPEEPAPLLGKTLLDIGCGHAYLADEMTFRGADVTAIDTNADTLADAKKVAENKGAIVSFINTSVQDYAATSNQTFDVILCLDMLDNTADKDVVMAAAAKLLNPDGVLIISAKAKGKRSFILHKLLASLYHRWEQTRLYYRHFTTPEDVRTLLTKHGFTLKDHCGVYLDARARRWRRHGKKGVRFLAAAIKKTD